MRRCVNLFDADAAALADELLGIAARHAGQSPDEGHSLATWKIAGRRLRRWDHRTFSSQEPLERKGSGLTSTNSPRGFKPWANGLLHCWGRDRPAAYDRD